MHLPALEVLWKFEGSGELGEATVGPFAALASGQGAFVAFPSPLQLLQA